MTTTTKPPAKPAKPPDKVINRASCEYPGCESGRPPSHIWHRQGADKNGNWGDLGDILICQLHDNVFADEQQRTDVIDFTSKDGMRNYARRLAQLPPAAFNSVRGPVNHVYMFLIDAMWTGEEGTERPGYVMNRYASVAAIARNTGMERKTADKALVRLINGTSLVDLEGHQSDKDKNGKARVLIDGIRLTLYQSHE